MCDRIDPEKNPFVSNIVENDGCDVENKNLLCCLKENDNKFIFCKKFTQELKICLKKKVRK